MNITIIDLEFLVDNKTVTVHVNLRPNGAYSGNARPTAMLKTEGQTIIPDKIVTTMERR